MNTKTALTVRKTGRSYGIFAGTVVLRKHRTEAAAVADLDNMRSFYEYWASSASTCILNAEQRVVHV